MPKIQGRFQTNPDHEHWQDDVDAGISNIEADIAALPIVLTGMVFPYAGTSAPTGYLLCYGQAVSRTTYADLFAIVSTTYGSGDGSTTFNLPDLRGRVIAGQDDMGGSSANRLTNASGGLDGDTLGATGGAETHTLTVAQLAAHSHDIKYDVANNTPTSGGAQRITVITGTGGSTSTAGIQDEGSDQPHNNVQPTIILNYIIKT